MELDKDHVPIKADVWMEPPPPLVSWFLLRRLAAVPNTSTPAAAAPRCGSISGESCLFVLLNEAITMATTADHNRLLGSSSSAVTA